MACACARTPPSTSKAPEGAIERAERALAEHDCATARLEAKRSMANVKIARALTVLGACDEMEGDAQDAVALYEDALSVDAHDVDASKRLASLLIDLGSVDRALAVAHRALAIAPGDGDLWLSFGAAWERMGDEPRASDAFGHAVEAFRRVAKLHEDDARFRLRFARALIARGDVEAARAELGAVVALAEGDADLLAEAALAFTAAGEPKRCISALDDALEESSSIDARRRALLLADRARCKFAAHDLAGARADANASLALDPTLELHLEAARWDESAGDKRGCVSHYVAAAKLAAGTPVEKAAQLGAQRCST